MALVVGCALLMPPLWLGGLRGLVFIGALIALTVIREVGRVVAGRAIGLKPAIVEIGEGESLFRRRVRGVVWDLRSTPISSATSFVPPEADAPWLRARLAVLLVVRSAVTLAVLLGIRALGGPLAGGAEGIKASLLSAAATAAEVLLLVGLVPFALTGISVVPLESDGLQLAKLPFAKREDLAGSFARYYLACAIQALRDNDPAHTLAACREGLQRFGRPPWSEAFRGIESVALARTAAPADAQAKLEQELARDLNPVSRALALNNWSWFAFLAHDEAQLRLADRRSADALMLQPELAAFAGTRGAVLLWQGRVTEALPLLEKSRAGATDARARDTNACLVAMAYAARGQSARAQAVLEEVKDPSVTDGLWAEAERRVKAAAEPIQIVRATRGQRALIVKGDGVELHEGSRVQRLAASEIERAEVGLTARGRARLSLRHAGKLWRLPLDKAELAWTRMLIGGSVVVPPGGGPGAAAAASDRQVSVAAQERAYAEYLAAKRLAVSSPKGVLFVGSAVAFAASMLISTSWQLLAVIMPVLFIHELGHWLAMRAFGHRDARISFIPFLGAATFTKDPFEKRWQEVVMLLAGPVPGIILGVALLILPLILHVDGSIVRSLAVMSVALNAANLLPFHPLDGGRIVHALVTAGRPRLDLAFKSLATLAFIAGGLALKDAILGIIALVGVMGWRSTYRLARLEERIRGMPGFDADLPIAERRGFVFRALAGEPGGRARDWGATVAALDTPLGYRRSPPWRVVVAAVFFVLVVAFGLAIGHFLRSVRQGMRCPDDAAAAPLACTDTAAFDQVAWKPRRGHGPRDTADPGNPARFPLAAFVWCHAADTANKTSDRLRSLERELTEASAGAAYCAAFPWEELPPESDASVGARARARRTLSQLPSARYFHGERAQAIFDKRVHELGANAELDAEIVQLLRQEVGTTEARVTGEVRDKVAQRLGLSPTMTCERISISNVESEGLDNETSGARPRGADMPETNGPDAAWVRFSVGAARPSDLDPLARYLCNAGCRITVLPSDPSDTRLRYCF